MGEITGVQHPSYLSGVSSSVTLVKACIINNLYIHINQGNRPCMASTATMTCRQSPAGCSNALHAQYDLTQARFKSFQ